MSSEDPSSAARIGATASMCAPQPWRITIGESPGALAALVRRT